MTNHLHKNDLPDDVIFKDSVAIDTETMGLNFMRDRLCLVQLSDGNGDAHLVQFDVDNDYAAPNLKKILEDENIQKIFHFARFDITTLQHYLGVPVINVFCTKIASRLARTYTAYHGLKDLCAELLGVNISKAQQSSNWGAEKLTEAQIKYAAQDVLYLHELRKKLLEMLQKENRIALLEDCCAFLGTRVALDMLGWHELDIFSH